MEGCDIGMTEGEREYFNIGSWLKDKLTYQIKSKSQSVQKLQINYGEVWFCDMGYNIGDEKNKMRPVLVISNNKINQSKKVVVLCITDAKNKLNKNGLPCQDSWYLLYSNTTDNNKMYSPRRIIRKGNTPYNFLDKDSIVQCEDIRSVSKARMNTKNKCLGIINPNDMNIIKNKFSRTYNL
jgi:mRNA-degrading endonuclease toxin of MazEF toxin-antitoxin module